MTPLILTSSICIQALTIEKVYAIAQFGQLKGRIMIVIKALNGLKTRSGAQWHQKLAANLCNMGFCPCKANYDFWIQKVGNHYDYIAVMADNLLIFSKDPEKIKHPIQELFGYELQNLGVPDYYSGTDIEFNKENGYWEMSAKT
jgi:hypothetical protein